MCPFYIEISNHSLRSFFGNQCLVNPVASSQPINYNARERNAVDDEDYFKPDGIVTEAPSECAGGFFSEIGWIFSISWIC